MDAFWTGFYAALGVLCAMAVASAASAAALVAAALVAALFKKRDDRLPQERIDGRS